MVPHVPLNPQAPAFVPAYQNTWPYTAIPTAPPPPPLPPTEPPCQQGEFLSLPPNFSLYLPTVPLPLSDGTNNTFLSSPPEPFVVVNEEVAVADSLKQQRQLQFNHHGFMNIRVGPRRSYRQQHQARVLRDDLVKFLENHCMVENSKVEQGFEKTDVLAFDFVYLPIDFKTGFNKGYAFVNFTTSKAAWKFNITASNSKWEMIMLCFSTISMHGWVELATSLSMGLGGGVHPFVDMAKDQSSSILDAGFVACSNYNIMVTIKKIKNIYFSVVSFSRIFDVLILVWTVPERGCIYVNAKVKGCSVVLE
ncbi:hypothetical protein Ahy_A03g016338 [Arachis hypogaea]|uniref:Mei2-like C-terminal RNA recognition motif domain-containing protein n=1 Tax=Arachis hypogaea TaxID=3818 RepID=A0A445E2X3_ARAHY|nr:hypothetical protein Ahy_A03g016338 [Arachis hypogaea]